jgi:hypothetical protein
MAVTEREAVEATGTRCQARPAAARHGWRDDLLCASYASTSVRFHGEAVSVCAIHESAYRRWGDQAELKAVELWGWCAHADLAQGEERRRVVRRVGHDRRAV